MPRDESPSSVNCSFTISSCADPTRTSLPDNRRSTKRSLIPAVDAGALHLASGVADGLPCVSTHEVAGGARSSRKPAPDVRAGQRQRAEKYKGHLQHLSIVAFPPGPEQPTPRSVLIVARTGGILRHPVPDPLPSVPVDEM
jgi:hypothetical protein